ncbi:MAG: carbohydrate ABC transporter permease [Coprobacillus sp.]|nr:carbohydrate ABC transporter permease [Coprobacillus sp.]
MDKELLKKLEAQKPKKKFKITGTKVLRFINVVLLVLIGFSMIYPLWEIVVKSFMTDKEIISSKSFWWPKTWQFEGYKTIFQDKTYNFGRAFLNSVFVTVTDTIYQLIITTITAYALSKKTLPGKKFFHFFYIFTMYFGGGMIPYYLVIRELGLLDNILVLIVPSFISIYNVLIMKSFFQSFPQELLEAAKIDGTGELGAFIKVVLPLSKAILATIALFIAVGVWNNWFTTMLFIQDPLKRPMAYTLQVIIEKSTGANVDPGSGMVEVIGESVQYAAIVVSTLPIIIIYPFLQKHFTKGVMIGSIKG